MFDPYRKWLGIPEDQRPPTHYQLLGISPDERDLDVIEAAVLRQSSFVRNFQTGPHAEAATQLLNEISAARLCLVNPQKRAKYDADLGRRQPAKPPSHSSARHSDLAIPILGAPPPAQPKPAPRQPLPSVDLDRLLGPPPRRAAAPVRRRLASNRPAPGRRPAQHGPLGYVWQIPLLTVILVILMLFARTIGRTIAEQRAQRAPPVQAEGDEG